MAPRIVWRYRRKRHTTSAARSRHQERGFGTFESQAAGGQQLQRLEQKDHQAKVQFAEEDEAQAKIQFQEEEEQAQAKVQFQEEEEEEAQPKVQFQEEEEQAQAKIQFQEEEEQAQPKIQFQEEEEQAQTKVQLQEEEQAQPKPEPVSRRSSRLIRSVAKSGFKGNAGSYPFQHRIQAAFGRHDISTVKAFSDAAAKQANRSFGSLAYASREKVAFRGYPDLHTAAHEAAHIIQQRQGVQLTDGAGRKDDPYERHADAVADRVVQSKSVQSLLKRTPASDGS
jgi:outer membrane biosynthesis protein TonB